MYGLVRRGIYGFQDESDHFFLSVCIYIIPTSVALFWAVCSFGLCNSARFWNAVYRLLDFICIDVKNIGMYIRIKQRSVPCYVLKLLILEGDNMPLDAVLFWVQLLGLPVHLQLVHVSVG